MINRLPVFEGVCVKIMQNDKKKWALPLKRFFSSPPKWHEIIFDHEPLLLPHAYQKSK